MKHLKQLFESIEKDDKIDYMNGGYQMLAVFSRETLRRAEELEAPEQLRIIRPQELGFCRKVWCRLQKAVIM